MNFKGTHRRYKMKIILKLDNNKKLFKYNKVRKILEIKRLRYGDLGQSIKLIWYFLDKTIDKKDYTKYIELRLYDRKQKSYAIYGLKLETETLVSSIDTKILAALALKDNYINSGEVTNLEFNSALLEDYKD